MARRKKQVISGIVLLLILTSVATFALLFAEAVMNDTGLQNWVLSFGYFGIAGLATIAGLNVIVPIPAATLTPIFTAGGLALPGIIIALTIGTLLSDIIGYAFGKISRATVTTKYPRLVNNLESLYKTKRRWVLPVTFLYAAFIPIPNEALIIPLAFLGVRLHTLILPLLVGNLINQTIYAYSFQNVFWYLF